MNSHNHWLSSTLTRWMVPAISEILKGNWRRILRAINISSWQANGELNVSCLGSAQHSCGACSILKQESDLDIEIHRKYPLRQKILSLGRISKDDPLCKISVKFDDLWDHLVSETQEGTNCRLIFASFASNLLRILQQISRWNPPMEFQDYNFGSLPRYAIMVAVNI